MALDLDPDRVRQAAAAGDSVVFGDAARLQALMAAGLARASAVVVTYLDVPGALKVLANTRAHAPQVPVIVRTQDDHDLERLQAAGATEVVPETIEGSLMLASHALALVGVPMRRVIRVVAGPARCALQPAARLFPRRRRRQGRRARPRAAEHLHALGGRSGDRAAACTACVWKLWAYVSPACAAAMARPPKHGRSGAGGRRYAGAVGQAGRAGDGDRQAAKGLRSRRLDQLISEGFRFSSSICCCRRTAAHWGCAL